MLGCVLCLLVPIAASASDAREQTDAVDFRSFVNADYKHLPKLFAWLSTREIIAKSLGQHIPGEAGQHITDGTPAQLEAFLSGLPEPPERGVQVIYLASQQTPDGAWVFPDRSRVAWADLLNQPASVSSGLARRVVILDSCYSQKTAELAEWRRWAPLTLCGSASHEVVWEIDFDKRQPRDFRKRLPQAWAALCKHPPTTPAPRRLSYTGAMWLTASLENTADLSGPSAWPTFLASVADTSSRFRAEHGLPLTSTLLVVSMGSTLDN